jgi:hypothetical protein
LLLENFCPACDSSFLFPRGCDNRVTSALLLAALAICVKPRAIIARRSSSSFDYPNFAVPAARRMVSVLGRRKRFSFEDSTIYRFKDQEEQ